MKTKFDAFWLFYKAFTFVSIVLWILIIIAKKYDAYIESRPKTVETVSNGINHNMLRQPNEVIEEHVKKLDSMCPLDINNGAGKVLSVNYDGRHVVYQIKVTSNIPLDIFRSQMETNLKNMKLYLYVIFDGENDEYLNAVLETDCPEIVKMTLVDNTTSTLTFNANELREIRDYVRNNRDEALNKYIRTQLEIYNNYLSVDKDDELYCSSIQLDDDFIVYNYIADKDVFRYHKGNYDEMKTLYYQDLKDSGRAILESCKAAKIGVKCKVTQYNSSQSLEFEYPYDVLMTDPFIVKLDLSEVLPL